MLVANSSVSSNSKLAAYPASLAMPWKLSLPAAGMGWPPVTA